MKYMLKTLFDWPNDWKGMSNVLVLIYGIYIYIYTHTCVHIQYMVAFVGQTREGSHLLALSLWFVDVAVQSLSCLTLCNTWSAACKASLSFIIYHNLLILMSIALQLSHHLPPPTPPLLTLSQHQALFQWVGSSHQVAKVLELQLQHQSYHEYSGLISFQVDCFDLLAFIGILKSLLQYHSSKHQFFGTQPYLQSNSHIHIWLLEKNIALTIGTFVGKVMSLLFNMLSRFVIAFLPGVVQLSSVTQSCPTLCDPMNGSTPGLPVHHQLPELTQTHVHQVGDDIQPSHLLSSPSPPAPNPSQHQGLFQ